jgi:AraC-like DNA-binding protein
MSPRHFARAFRAETGITPAKAVERLRRSLVRLYGAPPSLWKRTAAIQSAR